MMIRVVHNTVDQDLARADCENLADVLERCDASREDAPHLFTHIRLDGLDLPEDSFDRLSEVSIDGVNKIEIESRPRVEIARSSLKHSGEYVVAIRGALDRTVDLFRTGRAEHANDLLAEVSDSLGVLVAAISGISSVFESSADNLLDPLQDLSPWLDHVLEGQAASDWVYVADILEYEVDPRLEGWALVMEAVLMEVS